LQNSSPQHVQRLRFDFGVDCIEGLLARNDVLHREADRFHQLKLEDDRHFGGIEEGFSASTDAVLSDWLELSGRCRRTGPVVPDRKALRRPRPYTMHRS
jgi:hypothetical protein